jgi:hypothetical protein
MSPLTPKTASYTFANWQRARQGIPVLITVEAMLFTDTWVTGEIPNLGPYAFLNTVASDHPSRALRPAVVMRMTHHYEPTTDPAHHIPIENDFDHYHGGDYLDEMAALASVFMGIRLKAGQVNREFRAEGDPLGRPTHFESKPDPQLVLEGRPQIPRLKLPANLNAGLTVLNGFPDRTVEQTNALIKAARQYQQAIWIADSDPSLAWLMLVSAVETAAVEWASNTEPVEQLKLAFPKIVKLITESSCADLLEPIAKQLDRLTRATKRFIAFIELFAPLPPENRPAPYVQLSYESADLRDAIMLIYEHRSRSLHEGIAFPMPMCVPPHCTKGSEDSLHVQEKPIALGMYSQNASWKAEQTPMLLNAFEHIARGALINWWMSLDETTI